MTVADLHSFIYLALSYLGEEIGFFSHLLYYLAKCFECSIIMNVIAELNG